MRFLIAALFLACVSNQAFATTQRPDVLIYGERKYAIPEIPMLGLWDYGQEDVKLGMVKPPQFDVLSTDNWFGYNARFQIRESKLFLDQSTGKVEGKHRKDQELIPGRRFPIVAKWFTGRIHLEVGGYDNKAREAISVIIFQIEQGNVTKTEFRERMKRVGTWNGLPQQRAVVKQKKTKRNQLLSSLYPFTDKPAEPLNIPTADKVARIVVTPNFGNIRKPTLIRDPARIAKILKFVDDRNDNWRKPWDTFPAGSYTIPR